jgi:hypothetical protein
MADAPLRTPYRPFGPTGGPIVQRFWSALRLDLHFYRGAAADGGGTGPAGAIVGIIAIVRDSPVLYAISLVSQVWAIALPIIAAAALLRWVIVAGVAFGILRLCRSAATFTSLLRVLAYADAPTMLFALTPWLEPAWFLPAHIVLLSWSCAATLVALYAADSGPLWRAALVTVPVFLVQQMGLGLMRAALQ